MTNYRLGWNRDEEGVIAVYAHADDGQVCAVADLWTNHLVARLGLQRANAAALQQSLAETLVEAWNTRIGSSTAEQAAHNGTVAGSTPARSTIDTAQERERLANNEAILYRIPTYLDALDSERAENARLRAQVEELDFLRHEGGPQSVAAIEQALRENVLPLLRRTAEDLLRCVSVHNDPATISGADWRDLAEDMEAVLVVEQFVGRPDDEYSALLDPVLDARMWEAHHA